MATGEQRSLFGEILDWMLAPLLLLWPMSVALPWLVAQNIANRPYDRELGELARALARQAAVEAATPAAAQAGGRRRLERAATQLLRPDDSDNVFYQVVGARGSAVPVLILTAADSVEQRVKGLDLGADDYMAKPFSLQELEARVRALTRRGLGTASSIIKHGPLSFDATGRVAYLNDQMVDLSARELSLLEVLLQRSGRLVSKDQLVERLCEWGEEVSNNAIEVYIHRLRKKIEQGPVRIATVRGLGYCLEKIAA
jgi:DNA-binding response OmpR family regulator